MLQWFFPPTNQLLTHDGGVVPTYTPNLSNRQSNSPEGMTISIRIGHPSLRKEQKAGWQCGANLSGRFWHTGRLALPTARRLRENKREDTRDMALLLI